MQALDIQSYTDLIDLADKTLNAGFQLGGYDIALQYMYESKYNPHDPITAWNKIRDSIQNMIKVLDANDMDAVDFTVPVNVKARSKTESDVASVYWVKITKIVVPSAVSKGRKNAKG